MNLKSVLFSGKSYFPILLILPLAIINSCSDSRSLKDKVPGWYEASLVYENGDSLVGKVTYYKNGQNKLEANYIHFPRPGVRFSANVVVQGKWEVNEDKLSETVESVAATPANLKEALEVAMQKGKKVPANRIVEVNEQHMVLENLEGVKTEYIRIKK
jgi:hypothetical protein